MQHEIENRQNTIEMKNIQYAARVYGNKAEKINYLIWILCICSALMSLVIKEENRWIMVIYISTEIAAFVLQCFMDRDAALFSQFRKAFDKYVLFQEDYSFDDKTAAKLNSVTRRKDYHIQIANNGHDNPPGVKDWYEFKVKYKENDVRAIIECQRQNNYWNKKMIFWKLMITILSAVLLLGILLVVFKIRKLDIIFFFTGTVALIIKFCERIWVGYKYIRLIPKMEGALESVNYNGNMEQIKYVQQNIEALREIPLFGMNFIHKVFAKKISEEYASIQKNRNSKV